MDSLSLCRGARWLALACAVLALLPGCVQRDTRHHIVISVPEQRLVVFDQGQPVAEFPVSTSKFCLSDRPGSCGTPLGELEIERKIGGGAPAGSVFRDQRPTGEILRPNAPGRDPIVSRILWLKGLQAQNANAYRRYIYIHGTDEEAKVGTPASYGCIRMRSADVIRLYDTVGVGARVTITANPLSPAPRAVAVNQ